MVESTKCIGYTVVIAFILYYYWISMPYDDYTDLKFFPHHVGTFLPST